MSAAQQVFDTNELLEIIICQVEPHQIPELKRVNKTWRDTIKSKAVQRARVCRSVAGTYKPYEGMNLKTMLETMDGPDLQAAMHEEECEPDATTAFYSTLAWLRVNPLFDKVHSLQDVLSDGSVNLEIVIRLPLTADATVLRHLDEFITTPPCRSITIARMVWQKHHRGWAVSLDANYCWADNMAGVRVKDVLALRDQVSRMPKSFPEMAQACEIVATFRVFPENPSSTSHELSAAYFNGPLPRFRKASHKLDGEGVEAYHKDEQMAWEP